MCVKATLTATDADRARGAKQSEVEFQGNLLQLPARKVLSCEVGYAVISTVAGGR